MHATFPEEDMTSIVEIPVTMSSREIAELTSKEHKNVMADIRKMLVDLGYDLDEEGRSAEFSADLPDSYGRLQPAFLLPRELTEVLILGYSAALRLKVVRRLRELEQAQLKPPVSPALHDPAATLLAIGKGLLDMVPGINPAIMAAKTLTAITDNTGLDTSALRLALPASETPTEAMLNATQLGKLLGISAQKVNKRLTDAGLQYRDDKGNWLLTPEGTKHAEALPFERHGHAGYQVMWRTTVVGLIETHH
ncbi:Rha family transcriptional regulator [Azotobacter chroococcum]|uniref:Rha family transcriptional regulator n=2 Tax=Azotobacter chroococcum TaxID=353 RepID=A0AAP9YGB3_9GAMM|nr:Rha family transcriptional regulator [Azotobacter chroococcum]